MYTTDWGLIDRDGINNYTQQSFALFLGLFVENRLESRQSTTVSECLCFSCRLAKLQLTCPRLQAHELQSLFKNTPFA